MAEVMDSGEEASEIAAEEAKTEQAAQSEPKVEDAVPDEFKGMSVAELARIAQHARKEMGRQGNELGEIRKLADELIKSQLQKKQPEPEPVKEVDFFENPQEAMRRAVETNPRVIAAEQFAVQTQKAQAKQTLVQLHPDFQQVVQDSDFSDWVKKSNVRSRLFQQAENYDVEAAHELLSTFKELKAVKQHKEQEVVSDAEKTARAKSLQSAQVDTGGSGESSKKIYRRTDLIRLKMRDPVKYADMADEILLAYGQGRVK